VKASTSTSCGRTPARRALSDRDGVRGVERIPLFQTLEAPQAVVRRQDAALPDARRVDQPPKAIGFLRR
jgi:hypothetical protein